MAEIDWRNELGVDILSLADAQKVIGGSNNYYVYIIWKMYKVPPEPFYVGKGHRQRLIKHEMDSELGTNKHKDNILSKHKKLGVKCAYSIVGLFENEIDALQVEIELISLIGRNDLQQGPLSNKTDGGDGTRGHLALKGGESYSARPVIADGKRFLCLKDAADYFGVSSGSVSARIKNGWDGYFYEGEGQRDKTKKILERYEKEVSIDGKVYPSVSQASRELGLSVKMISKRVMYGWHGYFYVSQGQLPRRAIWDGRVDKVSVIVRGEKYATISDASLATGESRSKISKRCLSSNYPDYSREDGKFIAKLARPRLAEGVFISGEYFPSIAKAANAYNLTTGSVSHRCRSSNYPDWIFGSEEKQRAEEVCSDFSSNPISVTIDGVYYSSQSQAAKAHSIDINTLKKRCKSHSFPSWECVGLAKSLPKDGRPGLIGVEIDGVFYRSISEASNKTGISRPTIKKRLESDDWPEYRVKNYS